MADKPPKTPPIVVIPPDPAQVGDLNVAPTTTAADDMRTAGQRRVNILWETTQAICAIIVVIATLWVAGSLALKKDGDVAAFLLLSNVFFMVVTTYFTRTNHTRIGGVEKNHEGR